MNKLGFYIEKTTDPLLRSALKQIQPPVVVIHAQDRGMLLDIRKQLSPDTFVIGRLFKTQQEQEAMLDNDHPGRSGWNFAEEILRYDFKMAQERDGNGRLLIDAWMSLNEIPPGPASFPGFQVNDEYKRRAEHYDRFQDAFRQRLESEGVDAVAFNFAAGNYIHPEHYLAWFPRTLENYIYLGFHEYGWPSLRPESGGHTSALFYRDCMEGIRKVYGNRHQVIITEMGLTMAYGHPANPDRGWLNHIEPLTEERYWQSLSWYNNEILKDNYVLGACLFQVGHTGRWETFRHFGVDNNSQTITLIPRIAGLGQSPDRPPAPERKTPLREVIEARMETLETALADLLAVVGEMPERIMLVESQIAALKPAAEQAQAVTVLAAKLRTRLNHALSTLDSLQKKVDADAVDLVTLQESVSNLERQLQTMEPYVASMKQAVSQVENSKQALPDQLEQVEKMTPLIEELKSLSDQTQGIRAEIPAAQTLVQSTQSAPRSCTQPELLDVRDQLPQHPSKRYHTRELLDIHSIVVHQTATPGNTPPYALAQVQIMRQAAPGITYHFLIQDDGTIYWTQSLEKVLQNTLHYETNLASVAVALAGNFRDEMPSPAQLTAAADVIAWLVSELRLGIEEVVGRSELESVLSPGSQWTQGARYKKTLMGLVRARLMSH